MRQVLKIIFSLLSVTYISTAYAEQFVSVADLHFDPFTSCTSKPCPFIDQLRQAPVNQWPSLFAANVTDVPKAGQDANYVLLESTLAELKRVEGSPQFVLMLGDMLAHYFPEKYAKYSSDKSGESYQAFVKKVMEFLVGEINKTYPTVDVYPVVGNNDTYGEDNSSDVKGIFFQEIAPVWSSLIKDKTVQSSMQNQFSVGGYYVVSIPGQPDLQLIVLNSILFTKKGRGKNIFEAADNELDWLHETLKNIAAHHQHAMIALHVPVGVDVFATLRSGTIVEPYRSGNEKIFLQIVEEFSDSIIGIFPSHFHQDWFQIMPLKNPIIVSATPSISPYFGNNPAFKVYDYSKQTLQLENFVVYFDSLKSQQWDLEYNFKMISAGKNTLLENMQQLQETGDFAERYQTYYSVSTASIAKYWRYYWCDVHAVTAEAYQVCLQ